MSLTAEQTEQLLSYLDQLIRWNKTFNLTAVRDPIDMIDRHLLDSLAVLPLMSSTFGPGPMHLMDVGTGAGLPGIPIALIRPDTTLTLVETNGKKAAFLRQCQMQLNLQRVQICQSRVEALAPDALQFGHPDLVIARAFRGIGEFLELIAPFISPTTSVFAMKGPALDSELAQLKHQLASQEVSERLQSILGTHQMTTEPLKLSGIDLCRQVAVLRAPSLPGIRPSAVFLQE